MLKLTYRIQIVVSGLAFLGPDDKYSAYIDRMLDFSEKLDDTQGVLHHEMTHTPSQTIDGKCVWVVYIEMPDQGGLGLALDVLQADIRQAYTEVMNETCP